MNKSTLRESEEDLWHWAERRDAPVSAQPLKAHAPDLSLMRPTGSTAKKWLSMLGFSRSKRG